MATAGNSNRKRSNSSPKYRNSDSRSMDRRSSAPNRYEDEEQAQKSREMKVEIMTIVFVAVMLLLFLCNFHIIGSFGEAVSGFLFGVFGLLAYVTPVVATVLFFFFKANPGNHRAYKKLSAVIALYFLIGIICDMASKTAVGMEQYSFTELYKLGREGRCGGGLISGSLAFAIKSLLGTVGLVLLLILGIIVSLIVITDKSLIEFIKNKYYELVSNRPSKNNDFDDNRRIRSENEDAPRLADKAPTVRDRMKAEADKNEIAVVEESTDVLNQESAVSGAEEVNSIKMPEVPTYKPNLRESLSDKLQKSKEKRAEDKKRRAEERENNEILKVQPPVNESYPVNDYVPSQEVHEITYSEESFENNTLPKADEYSEPVKAVSYNQPHRIPKQDIRSSHNVTVVDQYEPMDGYDEVSVQEQTYKEPIYKEPIYKEPVYREPVYTEPAFNESKHEEPVATSDINDVVFGEQKNLFDDDVQQALSRPRAVKPVANADNYETVKSTQKNDSDTIPASQNLSNKPYKFPPISLLKAGKAAGKADRFELENTKHNLQETLRTFGVNVDITEAVQGPAVTRYEMTLEPGTKVSKILGLADDIKLSLASEDIRIEAPIPGKSAVGIEVPNKENSVVSLRELIENVNFKESKSTLSFAVGKNIGGDVIVTDIAKMPHVLIAGATGSGKSVCINTLIMSLIYKSTPEDVQMIMIDPKVVELSVYNGIPHLMLPVVTDPKKASAALAWGVKEMESRYKKFADLNVRDLAGYNEKIQTLPENDGTHFKLPKIVIIIDELADLMMVCGKEVEEAICRLAQLARACGIHLVVATQRPSVDVITGLIKANMPSRMAFAVSSGVDSRTILDTVGAEKLLGKGDMLFYPQGKPKPERVQGAFVSDDEVSNVVDFLKNQRLHNHFAEKVGISADTLESGMSSSDGKGQGSSGASDDGRDELFAEAGRCIINSGKASIGYLQRMLKIGFNRAARIMDNLAEEGVVGPESGTKAREILMTIEEFESYIQE